MPKKILGVLILVMVLSLGLSACDTTESESTSKVASVGSMVVLTSSDTTNPFGASSGALAVYLKPENAKANVTYKVDLYENGNLRDTVNISWNQPEINVAKVKNRCFRLSEQEVLAYEQASTRDIAEGKSEWWKPIFSIEVHE
jgi:hypothetical protein